MIDKVINDSELLELLDKYSAVAGQSTAKASDIISKLAYGIKNPELIVPVLGAQGMGKSTLINAILGANILPNDADETTCVPVEIRYGEKEKAAVHFQSGDTTGIELSCDALREFVDNNENSGNSKHVSHVVIEAPNELLKNGLVIVDLPGVGSLTQNNQETTMRYISRLCTAIFVIPTVPTIRRSEEIFIRGAWSSFSSAIFVQNRWDDETDEEVNDSVAFNTIVLNKIAESTNTSFSGKICVVNAYKAILGRLHNNANECAESNLPELLDELENLNKNRIHLETESFKRKVALYIETAQAAIRQYIKESRMNKEQLCEERERIRNEFNSATKEIQSIVDNLIESINSEKEEANGFIKNLSETSAQSLRADIRRLIDNGIVDGEQLTEAFADCQEKYLIDAIEQHYDYMNQMTYELKKQLDVLEDKINVEKATSFEALRFDNGQAFKFEKGIEIGANIAGALGGVYAGNIAGTAAVKLVEGIEIAAGAAGPVGIAVGIAAAVGISIVSSLIGKKVKQEITAKRGLQAKRAIEPLIDEFKKKLYTTISSSTNDVLDGAIDTLNTYMENRRTYFKEQMRYEEQSAAAEYQDKFDIDELNEQYNYLESKKEGLK